MGYLINKIGESWMVKLAEFCIFSNVVCRTIYRSVVSTVYSSGQKDLFLYSKHIIL